MPSGNAPEPHAGSRIFEVIDRSEDLGNHHPRVLLAPEIALEVAMLLSYVGVGGIKKLVNAGIPALISMV